MLKKYKVFRTLHTIDKENYNDLPPRIWTDHAEGIEDRILEEVRGARDRGFYAMKHPQGHIKIIPWAAISDITYDIMEVE